MARLGLLTDRRRLAAGVMSPGETPRVGWRLISWPYLAGARFRRGLYQKGWLAPKRLPAPVVSVGNLTVGGTGKTPVTACLARLLQEQGLRVVILSRGYGGRRSGVTCLSDGERLYYQPPEVGEEAYWLGRSLPGVLVYTGPCRYAAGIAAWRDHRPDIFLLDDGFQHFQLARDLDLVLLDAEGPFGNGRLLPAGPLREPLSTLHLADLLILTRFDENRHRRRLTELRRAFPRQEILTAAIEPTAARLYPGGAAQPLETLGGLPALAFAGLARPQVFAETLTGLGVALRGFRGFPDHHPFTAAEKGDLIREARRRGAAGLITTAKDWARLGERWEGDLPLWVLEVAARVSPEADLRRRLEVVLQGRGGDAAFPYCSPDSRLSGTVPLPPQVLRAYGRLVLRGIPLAKAEAVWEILVRVPNWVGDAVMSLPLLNGLRPLFPQAGVTVLAAPRVAPLFAGQPGVKEVITYPPGREKWGVLWGLRKRFDLALALPNSFESALGLWLTGVPYRVGYAANGRSPWLTTTLAGRRGLSGLHQVYYYLGLLWALGEVREFAPPRLSLAPAEREEGLALLAQEGPTAGGPWVGLAPGAAYGPAKRWPVDRFAAVADLLREEFQARVVILGASDDGEAAAAVAAHSRGPVLNLAGRTTLRQALMVLSQVQALITNDSGLMHAAAALGVPLVAIFGSTDPAATGPFSSRAAILHRHLPCSPCLERTCDRGYPCLTEISVDEVAAAARRWLEEP